MLKNIWILLLLFTENYALRQYISHEMHYKPQNCMCVPFWQCKDDSSSLLDDDEIDLADIRVAHAPPLCTGDFDVCCKVQCGQRSDIRNLSIRNKLAKRILGVNNEAEFAEFPWMLGILRGKTYRCGASLIHPSVALTAAHCVDIPGQYKVRGGEWNWENNNEPLEHQDRLTKKVIIHPQYHSESLRNDIALLLLKQPFDLKQHIGLICLPPQNMIFDHTKCIATGWGKSSYHTDSYQPILKKMHLPIVSRVKCLKSLQDNRLGPSFFLHKSFICAGGEPNKDTCKGDGGSPLICPIYNEPNRYEQVGIVSWGLTCGIKNTPGVYVNVALFIDWIYDELSRYDLDVNVYV